MKHIIVWILAAMLLILVTGCVPDSLTGLVQELADASVLDVPDEENSTRKLGASLFDFYGDPAITAFAADFDDDPPQTLIITRNWEESAQETVTDAETIAHVFALLKPIVVEERVDMYYTDSDTFLTFTYADGRAFEFAFNYRHLAVNSDTALGFAAYRLSGDEGLWKMLRG